jgi:23S rRNA (guanine2445-N2)-methyltransferase / 23S rRNA (guanine2069-N7)-methyltransferase
MEPLLCEELQAFGAEAIKVTRAGIGFQGSLDLGYRVCLWSRVASRVLLTLSRFAAPAPEALYEGVQAIDWDEHLAHDGTLAVDFNAANSHITHTHYGALKVKDAIVDQLRDRHGVRPSVALERPDVRINVYLYKNQARLSLDLSGEGLHRRGYRTESVAAPLKENLAAAMLLSAGWPALAAAHAPLLDPMCGSGTLPIEAALIAGDIAPGLLRDYYGFLGWLGHVPAVWARLLEEAAARRQAGLARIPTIVGYDADRSAVRAALANVASAVLMGRVHIERRDIAAAEPVGQVPGLVMVNPPYGERVGQDGELPRLYAELGTVFKRRFGGWQAVMLTGNPELSHRLRLKPVKTLNFYNGAIPCRWLHYSVPINNPRAMEGLNKPAVLPLSPDEGGGEGHERGLTHSVPGISHTPPAAAGAEMFANRLRKNLKTLGRWARREGITCYRLYDADLPEFALAIDLYQGDADLWVHVQEYQAPATVDADKAAARLTAALALIAEVLAIDRRQVFFKLRQRQRGSAQYEKLDHSGEFYEVREGPCRFLVNFTDYLDTGLFLDHRPVRAMIRSLAQGKQFLNLFAYTGTATVAAAVGVAAATTSVDMSRTYLDWTQRNLRLNGFDGEPHRLLQADCLAWIDEGAKISNRYDLIWLDPPTFSNSKRMDGTFDVQRDHVDLIRKTVQLLAPEGVLLFSTNRRKFKLDAAGLDRLEVQDLTEATVPQDFARHGAIHQCWRIGKR